MRQSRWREVRASRAHSFLQGTSPLAAIRHAEVRLEIAYADSRARSTMTVENSTMQRSSTLARASTRGGGRGDRRLLGRPHSSPSRCMPSAQRGVEGESLQSVQSAARGNMRRSSVIGDERRRRPRARARPPPSSRSRQRGLQSPKPASPRPRARARARHYLSLTPPLARARCIHVAPSMHVASTGTGTPRAESSSSSLSADAAAGARRGRRRAQQAADAVSGPVGRRRDQRAKAASIARPPAPSSAGASTTRTPAAARLSGDPVCRGRLRRRERRVVARQSRLFTAGACSAARTYDARDLVFAHAVRGAWRRPRGRAGGSAGIGVGGHTGGASPQRARASPARARVLLAAEARGLDERLGWGPRGCPIARERSFFMPSSRVDAVLDVAHRRPKLTHQPAQRSRRAPTRGLVLQHISASVAGPAPLLESRGGGSMPRIWTSGTRRSSAARRTDMKRAAVWWATHCAKRAARVAVDGRASRKNSARLGGGVRAVARCVAPWGGRRCAAHPGACDAVGR